MNSRSSAFFKQGEKKLELAKDELLKPAEDVVGFSVCKNAQFAIENFLKGFLLSNDIAFDANETIEVLYNKCIAFDKNFKDIDINPIKCKNVSINERYCSEIDTVSACYDTADSIDTYLRKSKLI